MSEKIYSVIDEGQKIVDKLVEVYPDVLWTVRTGQIAVLGIQNKEATKRSPLFRVRSVKNAEKAVLQMNNIAIRYIIEMYWSEWNKWDTPRKEWVVLKALLSIGLEEGKLIKPDCSEYKIILDQVGFDWENPDVSLPSLTAGDPIPFDLDLRPSLDQEESETEED